MNPLPTPEVVADTVVAPKINSLAEVVVALPLLTLVPLPEAAAVTSRGAVVFRPLYSRIRISGAFAAALKVTVTMLAFAAAPAMLLA